MVASAQMKFASEARLSQLFPLATQIRHVCCYLDTLWTLKVEFWCTRWRDTNSNQTAGAISMKKNSIFMQAST